MVLSGRKWEQPHILDEKSSTIFVFSQTTAVHIESLPPSSYCYTFYLYLSMYCHFLIEITAAYYRPTPVKIQSWQETTTYLIEPVCTGCREDHLASKC